MEIDQEGKGEGGVRREEQQAAGEIALDELDERLRSRVLAASSHASTRSIRRTGGTFTVDARSNDRIVHLELSLLEDGSVAESNDSFVVGDVRRILAARDAATVDVEVAGPLRVVPVAAEIAATLNPGTGSG